jgi:hypothetical protein
MAVERGRPISRHTSVKSRLRSSSMLMVMAIELPIICIRHVLNTYYSQFCRREPPGCPRYENRPRRACEELWSRGQDFALACGAGASGTRVAEPTTSGL